MHEKSEKLWLLKRPDPKKVEQLRSALGASKSLCEILVSRGIETYEEAKEYFRPSLDYLHDPYRMLNMQSVVEKIQEAITFNKKIMVFGDYDVDGTMAVSMFVNFFTPRLADLIYYIPDRFSEGYGLSEKAILDARDRNVQLLITMDCGIKDEKNIALAIDLGMEVIIIDHHNPGENLPNTPLILNPKQENDSYPFNDLSAAGIVFKLLSAWSITECGTLDHALPFLDLAALSTAADVVPLIGENRTLLSLGLKEINKKINPIITRIVDLAGKGESIIDEYDIGFVIGPRINAIGRLGKASEVVRIFTCQKVDELATYMEVFNIKNEERKKIDKQITKEALTQIHEKKEQQQAKSTLVYDPNWHKGVVGIVASRLISTYYRPTVVCTLDDDVITCSARSIEGFDILSALDGCSDLLLKHGGHFYAAGMTLLEENLEAFRRKFEESVSERITEEMLTPKLHIDTTLDHENVNMKFYQSIVQMAPFGEQNPKPNFLIEKAMVEPGSVKLLKSLHITFQIRWGGHKLKVIGFNMPERYEWLSDQDNPNVHLVVQLMKNEWRGQTSLELLLQDIQISPKD